MLQKKIDNAISQIVPQVVLKTVERFNRYMYYYLRGETIPLSECSWEIRKLMSLLGNSIKYLKSRVALTLSLHSHSKAYC